MQSGKLEQSTDSSYLLKPPSPEGRLITDARPPIKESDQDIPSEANMPTIVTDKGQKFRGTYYKSESAIGGKEPSALNNNPVQSGVEQEETKYGKRIPDYNCHSYTFLPEKYRRGVWMIGQNIEDILVDNGFTERPSLVQSSVEDVVIFRDKSGRIIHSGFISRIEKSGEIDEIMVKSKMGKRAVKELSLKELQDEYSKTFSVYHTERKDGRIIQVEIPAARIPIYQDLRGSGSR
jgi:hypothetical protein